MSILSTLARALPYLTVMGAVYQLKKDYGWRSSRQPIEPENKLRKAFGAFIQSQNIREDVIFLEARCRRFPFCRYVGSHLDLNGGAYLYFNLEFLKRDKAAFKFVVKRDLLAIKTNDTILYPLMGIIGGVAIAYLFSGRVHTLAVCVMAIAGRSLFCLLQQVYSHHRRNKIVVAQASNDELCGRIRLSEAIRETYRQLRGESLYNYLTTLESGERRFAFFRPPFAQVIKETKDLLTKREAPYIETEENIDIQKKLTAHFYAFEKTRLEVKRSLFSRFVVILLC